MTWDYKIKYQPHKNYSCTYRITGRFISDSITRYKIYYVGMLD